MSSPQGAPEQVLERLKARDLLEPAHTVAREHYVELVELVDMSKRSAEVVRARHELWDRLHERLRNYSDVASVFGCDPSTVSSAGRLAAHELDIVEVILDCVEGAEPKEGYALRWRKGKLLPFGITNGLTGKTCWFSNFKVAEELFRELCAIMGEQTILGRSRAGVSSSLTKIVETPTPPAVMIEAATPVLFESEASS